MQPSRFSRIRAVLVVAMLAVALVGGVVGTTDSADARRRAAIDRGTCEDLGGTYSVNETGNFWSWSVNVTEWCDDYDGNGTIMVCDTAYDFAGRRAESTCLEI